MLAPGGGRGAARQAPRLACRAPGAGYTPRDLFRIPQHREVDERQVHFRQALLCAAGGRARKAPGGRGGGGGAQGGQREREREQEQERRAPGDAVQHVVWRTAAPRRGPPATSRAPSPSPPRPGGAPRVPQRLLHSRESSEQHASGATKAGKRLNTIPVRVERRAVLDAPELGEQLHQVVLDVPGGRHGGKGVCFQRQRSVVPPASCFEYSAAGQLLERQYLLIALSQYLSM